MSFITKAVVGVTAAAAVCLSAAGCGSSGSHAGVTAQQSHPAQQSDPLAGLTAKQIATKAISDLKAEPSFTMAGTDSFDGKTGTVSVSVQSNGCTTTLDMGPKKGHMTMVMIGKTMWMKGDAAFWKSDGGGAATSTFAGKYVKFPAGSSSAVSQTAGTCNRNDMTSSSSSMPLSTDVVKGAVTTVNGQRVYPLTEKSEDTTVYVTDTSTPQAIKIVDTKPGDSAQYTITYGAPKSITAPPASETVAMP